MISCGIMGQHRTPQIPLFFYKAIGIEICPVTDNDNPVSEYRAKGVQCSFSYNIFSMSEQR
jgi:hypothetical protein